MIDIWVGVGVIDGGVIDFSCFIIIFSFWGCMFVVLSSFLIFNNVFICWLRIILLGFIVILCCLLFKVVLRSIWICCWLGILKFWMFVDLNNFFFICFLIWELYNLELLGFLVC